MPLPPNPPAQLLEGVGPAGEEGRGVHATQNSHCIKGTCRLEGRGGGRPSRGVERTQPPVRRHAGQGGRKNRDGGKRAVGVQEGEASFQRRRGEGPPLGQISMG